MLSLILQCENENKNASLKYVFIFELSRDTILNASYVSASYICKSFFINIESCQHWLSFIEDVIKTESRH